MPNTAFTLLAAAALGLLSTLPVQAQLPPRDLVVELRQISEADANTVSTQPATMPLTPQRIQVRNGEKATLAMGQNVPIRFVQAVGSGRDGSGVSYGMVWMQAGQSMAVQPRWPGARQPVRITIAVESSSLQAPTGNAELPSQARGQLATTVSAPLGQWVTVAATGGGQAQPGSYSSEAAADTRQLVQIRVLAL
ncbi:hypothetical protein [Rhodoferax sp.]|uniref:hypothetical protein n=1 Tax=Rhodoferax sp. TaxID=50421 RepID=UPI0025E7FCE9|nr:hypothetical protein [Rhodoferax sp.]